MSDTNTDDSYRLLSHQLDTVTALASNLLQAYIEVAATLEVLVTKVMENADLDERRAFLADVETWRKRTWEGIKGVSNDLATMDPEQRSALEHLILGQSSSSSSS